MFPSRIKRSNLLLDLPSPLNQLYFFPLHGTSIIPQSSMKLENSLHSNLLEEKDVPNLSLLFLIALKSPPISQSPSVNLFFKSTNSFHKERFKDETQEEYTFTQ